MAEDNTQLIQEVFKNFNDSKKCIAQFKADSRLFIANLTTLIEKLETGDLDINSKEIADFLSEKCKYVNDVDCAKNYLEEIKNKLERLDVNREQQQLRTNRGRQNPSTDSGFGSIASSSTSTCSTDFAAMQLSVHDSSGIQEQTPHGTTRDGIENDDISDTKF